MFILLYTSYILLLVIRFGCGGFEKIDVPLLKKMGDAPRGTIFRVLVTFEPYQDSTLEKELEGVEGHLRSYKMYQILTMEANHTQYTLIQALKTKVPKPSILHTIYLVNVLVVEATKEIILKFGLDRLPENQNILKVFEDGIREREKEEEEEDDGGDSVSTRAPKLPDDWWKKEIKADPWIQAGYDGSNVIIGVIASGADADHLELHPSWYGPNYGFREPFLNTTQPFENATRPHGTEVLGILTGYRTGLAPGSKWIMCSDEGPPGANLTDILDSLTVACGDYLHCPDPDHSCSRRPRVINNSGGIIFTNFQPDPSCLATFGIQVTKGYQASMHPSLNLMVDKWLSAGQMPVFAAGNMGRNGCEIIGFPGQRKEVIQVGAVALFPSKNTTLYLAQFSAKGPPIALYPTVDWVAEKLYKPDIVAPGNGMLTTTLDPHGTGKTKITGTSAAAAVVSGAIALILSRNSDLNYEEVKNKLYSNTRTAGLKSQNRLEICGGISDDVIPNFKFGRGFLHLPDPSSFGEPVTPKPIPPDS